MKASSGEEISGSVTGVLTTMVRGELGNDSDEVVHQHDRVTTHNNKDSQE
jgi:hypothetical protein